MTNRDTNHETTPTSDSDLPEQTKEEAAAGAADDKPEISRPSSLDPWVRYKQRSQRVREEIARNRRGEYRIPTWGLVAILVGMLVVWAALIWLP